MKNIKNSSPFTQHFDKLLANLSIAILNTDKNENDKINDFYSPSLFQIIKKYLYILPLWSGLLLNIFPNNTQTVTTRLTINPVENWFGHLKNNILKNEKVFPSQLVGCLYKRLMSKYIQHYQDDEPKLKCEKNSLVEQNEYWSDKKRRLSRIKVIITKTFQISEKRKA